MHGFGIIVWPGGDVFEGEFYEDKKCGFGVFYNQKKVYMGNWKNNKPEGDVIIIDGENQKAILGKWKTYKISRRRIQNCI